jgi:hypothetical protein
MGVKTFPRNSSHGNETFTSPRDAWNMKSVTGLQMYTYHMSSFTRGVLVDRSWVRGQVAIHSWYKTQGLLLIACLIPVDREKISELDGSATQLARVKLAWAWSWYVRTTDLLFVPHSENLQCNRDFLVTTPAPIHPSSSVPSISYKQR